MKELYLVRHAKTAFPTEDKYCAGGRTDWSIGDEGRKQCLDMAGKLLPGLKKGSGYEVWSSPLLRARQTAEYLLSEGMELRTEEKFREMDAGEWDGLSFTEIKERYPEQFEGRMKTPGMELIPGAEKDEDGLMRFREGIEKILAASAHNTVVIVSHGTVIQLYLCFLAGRPLTESRSFRPDYADYVRVEL